MGTKSIVSVRDVSKTLGDTLAIDTFSAEISDGSITAVLAPSGAGKTTLLRLIVGFEKPDFGRITVDGNPVCSPNGQVGIVFQQSAVFPWLSVRQNIEFGLMTTASRDGAQHGSDARALARAVGIGDTLDRMASDLSGGQVQRVEIARALATNPRVLLLDEPFSALDESNRNTLRLLLLRLHAERAHAILLVTHNLDDAIFLGDRLLICDGPPLRLRDDVENGFAFGRDLRLLDSAEFAERRAQIRKLSELKE